MMAAPEMGAQGRAHIHELGVPKHEKKEKRILRSECSPLGSWKQAPGGEHWAAEEEMGGAGGGAGSEDNLATGHQKLTILFDREIPITG